MRLFLILATALFAVWLPHAPVQGSDADDAPASAAVSDQIVLPLGRYGGLQHRRTPLPIRAIALTFDDGPDPTLLPQVLDILDQHQVKATFFFVGVYAQERPDLVREVVRRGHNVASHSSRHPTQLRYWGRQSGEQEIRRGFDALNAALVDAPPEQRARLEPMFRFPGLNESPHLMAWMEDRGVMIVSAEAGTDDWRGYSADRIVRRTLAAMEQSQGGVLILHETRPQMILALPRLLTELKARGYTFVQITAGDAGKAHARSIEDPLIAGTA